MILSSFHCLYLFWKYRSVIDFLAFRRHWGAATDKHIRNLLYIMDNTFSKKNNISWQWSAIYSEIKRNINQQSNQSINWNILYWHSFNWLIYWYQRHWLSPSTYYNRRNLNRQQRQSSLIIINSLSNSFIQHQSLTFLNCWDFILDIVFPGSNFKDCTQWLAAKNKKVQKY